MPVAVAGVGVYGVIAGIGYMIFVSKFRTQLEELWFGTEGGSTSVFSVGAVVILIAGIVAAFAGGAQVWAKNQAGGVVTS